MKNIKKGEVIQLSANFKSSEFDCKGKNCCSSGIIDEKLIEWLQKIRNHFGVSVTVNSGFRCPTHNAKVGGSSSSHHMKGMAADIVVKGKTPREVAQYAEKIGIQRIGLYETDKDGYFVHIGSGTTKRFWYGQAGKEVTTFQTTTSVPAGNSPLVTYVNLSPNKNSPRNHKIDTITIHCVVGQLTAKQIVDLDKFQNSSGQSSCNYAVGTDGSIGLCVEEKDRAWTSSSRDNDHRAITIEVASDRTHPYAVNDKAYKALIELVTDICKRNNIKELKWKADKSLIGQIDKQNMTAHRWFANTSCPGDYLYSHFGDIATKVNAKLNPTVTKPTVSGEVYRVRASWDNAASQVGAYSSLDNAKKACDKAGKGYKVYNSKGVAVYPVQTEDPNPTLRKGNKGDKVKEVQTLLTNLGFPCACDGSFGSETQQQVIAFQKDRNLTKDGVVGPKTWAALRAFTPYKVSITANRLNVRAGASTQFKVVAQVKKNDIYTIIKKSGNWGLLKSRKGWISLNYTKKV